MRTIIEVIEAFKQFKEIKGIHKACLMFPPCNERDYSIILERIKKNGLLNPIALTPDGQLLDGRNRLLACAELGIEPTFTTVTGDPFEYAYDMNYAHRHLNDSQLAMIGAEFLEHETELAKQRKDAGLKQNARARNDSPTDKKGRASDKAGKKVGVSGKLVSQAAKLIEKAPELAEEVKAGKISVSAATKKAFPKPPSDEPSKKAAVKATDESSSFPFDEPDETLARKTVKPGGGLVAPLDPTNPQAEGQIPGVKYGRTPCPMCGYNLPKDFVKPSINKKAEQTDEDRRALVTKEIENLLKIAMHKAGILANEYDTVKKPKSKSCKDYFQVLNSKIEGVFGLAMEAPKC